MNIALTQRSTVTEVALNAVLEELNMFENQRRTR
jgi:hypothetical protein